MGKGIYANLEQQIEALRRKSTDTVSYKTQERYWGAFRRFCEFTASKFRLQNIKNISDKHLEAYIVPPEKVHFLHHIGENVISEL